MVMDRDLWDLMPQTVTVSTGPKSRSAYGTETASTSSRAWRARVTTSNDRITTDDGQTTQATHVVWMASSSTSATPPTVAHKFVLPGSPRVHPLKVEGPQDEDGVHHYKVWFGVGTSGGS